MKIDNIITKKIKDNIDPFYFRLINFSEQHSHHATNNRGEYSHIRLVIASDIFDNKSKVNRERLVHKVLTEELNDHVHALVLKLYSINEFKLLSTQDLEE